jgi:Probable cobalt transporter subunit (CbtA)
MVYSSAFGGLFVQVFAVADRRVVTLRPRAVSALLAASGFIAVYVVPNLKSGRFASSHRADRGLSRL